MIVALLWPVARLQLSFSFSPRWVMVVLHGRIGKCGVYQFYRSPTFGWLVGRRRERERERERNWPNKRQTWKLSSFRVISRVLPSCHSTHLTTFGSSFSFDVTDNWLCTHTPASIRRFVVRNLTKSLFPLLTDWLIDLLTDSLTDWLARPFIHLLDLSNHSLSFSLSHFGQPPR